MRHAPLLSASLALVAGLLIVEVATRILLPAPRFHQTALELDARLGFRAVSSYAYEWMPPEAGEPSHAVRFSEDGFRGRAFVSDAGQRAEGDDGNIVFLGDSFLVGESVPEHALITHRVEEHLRARGRPMTAYNLSVVDYGTGQQILLFDRFADRLRPEIVVLALYPANDLANNSPGLMGRTRVSPGDAIRPYVAPAGREALDVRWATPLRSALRRRSNAFALIERGFFPPRLGQQIGMKAWERIESGALPREFLEIFRSDGPNDLWSLAWQETESLLRALRDRCDARGARLLVVVIPSIHQVRQTPQSIGFDLELRAAGRDLAQAVDWNLPESRIERFGRVEGIDVHSLLPGFRASAAQGEELYARDQHLSRAGHALAAREIAEVIEPVSGPRNAAPAIGEPVAWQETSDPGWLDFRRAPHSKHLSDGWIEWQPTAPRHPGGWRIGRSGAIALRVSDGAFVVRGYAVSPLTLDLAFIGGGPRQRVDVTQPGPFTLEVPIPDTLPRSAGGQAAILFDVGGALGQLFVQQIGFSDGTDHGMAARSERERVARAERG